MFGLFEAIFAECNFFV